jgi:hypothetical protein
MPPERAWMSSASRVSTRLEGPTAMRIPTFLQFMGPKNNKPGTPKF